MPGRTTETVDVRVTTKGVSSSAAELRKLSGAVDSTSDAQARANTQFTQATKTFDSLKTAAIGMATAWVGLHGAMRLKDFIVDLDRMRNAAAAGAVVLGNQLAAGGISTARAMQELRAATKGVVGDVALLQSSARAMTVFANSGMETALAFDTIKTSAEFATIAAQSFGISAAEAFNRLITGLSRGSALILDDFGIMIDQSALMAAGMSESEKKVGLLNQAIGQMNVFLDANAAQVEENISAWDRATTSVSNFWLKVASGPDYAAIGDPLFQKLANAGSVAAGIRPPKGGPQPVFDFRAAAASGLIGPPAPTGGAKAAEDSRLGGLTFEFGEGGRGKGEAPAKVIETFQKVADTYAKVADVGKGIDAAGKELQASMDAASKAFLETQTPGGAPVAGRGLFTGGKGPGALKQPPGLGEQFGGGFMAGLGGVSSQFSPATLGATVGASAINLAVGGLIRGLGSVTGLFQSAADKQYEAAIIMQRIAQSSSGYGAVASFLGHTEFAQAQAIRGGMAPFSGTDAWDRLLPILQAAQGGDISGAIDLFRSGLSASSVFGGSGVGSLFGTEDFSNRGQDIATLVNIFASLEDATNANTAALDMLTRTLKYDILAAQIRAGYAGAAEGSRSATGLRRQTNLAIGSINLLGAYDLTGVGDYAAVDDGAVVIEDVAPGGKNDVGTGGGPDVSDWVHTGGTSGPTTGNPKIARRTIVKPRSRM